MIKLVYNYYQRSKTIVMIKQITEDNAMEYVTLNRFISD